MTDRLGRIWLIGLFLGLVVLSVYLWRAGKAVRAPSQITYLTAEAHRLLGCKPYLLSEGIQLDANGNRIPEYLFSCDSALTSPHRRFIWLEIEKKKVRILLWHNDSGWAVGGGKPAPAYSWLLDRANHQLLVLPSQEDTFAEPLEILWDNRQQVLRFAEPSDSEM